MAQVKQLEEEERAKREAKKAADKEAGVEPIDLANQVLEGVKAADVIQGKPKINVAAEK